MNDQLEFQNFLRNLLAKRRQKNGSYSLRAFARSLRLAPATASGVINGKRRVSRKMIDRVLDFATADPEERKKIYDCIEQGTSLKTDQNFAQVEADKYSLISEWYYFAILSLFDTENFSGEPVEISQRLGIDLKKAENSIERLIRLGLVERATDGHLRKTNKNVTSTDGLNSVALRKSHFDNLDLARNAMETLDLEERDFLSLTVATTPEKIGFVKRELRNFIKNLMSNLEAEEKTEVYRLCLQYFPLTKVSKEKP